MKLFLVALALLSGCSAVDVSRARNPYGSLIGGNVVDLLACAGLPDKVEQTAPDQLAVQYDYKREGTGFKFSVLLASVEVGGASSCRAVFTVLRDGTVADAAFPASEWTATGGPHAGCGAIVSECLEHPNATALPPGYDAMKFLLPEKAKG